jgi:hypothetical protein
VKKIAFASLLVGALASPVMAGQIQVYGNAYQNGAGGELLFQTKTPAAWLDNSGYSALTKNLFGYSDSFQTFCIEVTEHVSLGALYDASIDTTAKNGGSGGPNPDPVSQGTGWLYSQFATGTLAGYDYGAGGRFTTAGQLQYALWWLENEVIPYTSTPVAYDANNPFMLAAFNQFGGEANARLDGAETYGVYAVNMRTLVYGNIAQDGLYFRGVPDGGATLILLGGALIGLGALRRKFRS